jgi:hypothetical protein
VGRSNVSGKVKTLYRPVGQAELDLIRASAFREFPPRLPAQPFFYPVINEEYATQIARDWNTKDANSGFVGYVLRFDVLSSFLDKYEVHTVGDSSHREYWIPSVELEEFNRSIVGSIEIVSAYKTRADVISIFDLGCSEGPSNIAVKKDEMIGEAFDSANKRPLRD